MRQRHDQSELEEVVAYGFLSDGGTDRTLVLVVDRNVRRLGPFQMLPVIGRMAGSRRADTQQKKPVAGRGAVTAAGDVVQSLAQTGYHRHRGDQEPSDRFTKGTKHGGGVAPMVRTKPIRSGVIVAGDYDTCQEFAQIMQTRQILPAEGTVPIFAARGTLLWRIA